MRRFTKEQIVKGASILTVAESMQIQMEEVSTGNFTHRCRCPSTKHKSGTERTSSLYVDGENNNFYCFGCGASNNVIDFYILGTGHDFIRSMNDLCQFVDETKINEVAEVRRQTNFDQLMDIAIMFRGTLREHPEDFEWINSLMKKTDEFSEEMDRYDVGRAKALLKKVAGIISARYLS